jgi:hypothetical protein
MISNSCPFLALLGSPPHRKRRGGNQQAQGSGERQQPRHRPNRIIVNTDFNFWMVGGGNESGYGQQYGVRVALVGQRSGRTRNGALAAVSDELFPRRADRAAPVTPAWFADPQIRRI